MRPRTPPWRLIVAAFAIAALATLVALVVRALDFDAKVNIAEVAAVLLPAAVTVAGVLAWYRGHAARAAALRAPPGEDRLAEARDVLAQLVRRQWREESRLRSLDDPVPIPVAWQLSVNAALMSAPRLISQGEPDFAVNSADIVGLAEKFRALSRRRLVITGGRGMGKTTLAVQLLLRLVATRAADQSAAGDGEIVPVPVLFPISGWDVRAHPRLHDWLKVRLAQDYPALASPALGPDVAAALAERGHILPVLDGLDELPEQARAEVIEALNASLATGDQLVLTSRTAEFAAAVGRAGRVITGAAVITPRLLSPATAVDYLRACLPADPPESWREVLAALAARTTPGLTELASTPLGLWLIRAVYIAPGADPTPLTGALGGDASALRSSMLDQLIPALIKARPPSDDPADHFRPRTRLDALATRRYLAYLAFHFQPTTRDIAWWRIAGTASHGFRLGVRLAFGLLAGLVPGTAIGLMSEGFANVWVVGSASTVAVGLGVGFAARSWFDEPPGYAELRLRGRTLLLLRSLGRHLARWLGAVLAFALGATIAAEIVAAVFEIEAGFEVGASFALSFGPLLAFGGGLAVGLVRWAEQPTLTLVRTPVSSWRADRALTLLRVAAGAVFGSAATYLGGIALFGVENDGLLDLLAGLAAVVIVGLVFGMVVGPIVGRHHAWLVCVLSVTGLAAAGRLPWGIMRFLDDCHRLTLLRAAGSVYQFRHAELHDHLAAVHTRTRTSRAPDEAAPGG